MNLHWTFIISFGTGFNLIYCFSKMNFNTNIVSYYRNSPSFKKYFIFSVLFFVICCENNLFMNMNSQGLQMLNLRRIITKKSTRSINMVFIFSWMQYIEDVAVCLILKFVLHFSIKNIILSDTRNINYRRGRKMHYQIVVFLIKIFSDKEFCNLLTLYFSK